MRGSLGTTWGCFGCTLGTLWGAGAQEQAWWLSHGSRTVPIYHVLCGAPLCTTSKLTYLKLKKLSVFVYTSLMRGRKVLGGISGRKDGILRSDAEDGGQWGGSHSAVCAEGPRGC